jgi:hypothetical protein
MKVDKICNHSGFSFSSKPRVCNAIKAQCSIQPAESDGTTIKRNEHFELHGEKNRNGSLGIIIILITTKSFIEVCD